MEVKLLFITRCYPPQIGGMEKYSYDLYHALKENLAVDLLKHTGGKLFLPVFYVQCMLALLFSGNRYTHIHFGDAVLSPLGWFAAQVTRAKVSVTVHALDIIYCNRIYQSIVPYCLARLDKLVAVSRFALEQSVLRGVSRDRCHLIPNGINLQNLELPAPSLNTVAERYNINVAGKKILFSIGRLIKRKGIHWFVVNVMPGLNEDYIYLIAGDGPEYENIATAISKNGLDGKVSLLGRISEDEKLSLYRNASLFIMPNIPVAGDAEGFGITIIEAAACGLPAIASDLEGIPDAIVNGITGTLVEAQDDQKYAQAIMGAVFDRREVTRLTRSRYDWSVLKARYMTQIFI